MAATGWTVKGSAVKAVDAASGRWAKYDASGARIEMPSGWKIEREMPTAEMLADWDAAAPAQCAALLAADTADRARAARLERIGAVAAKFAGICAVSGRRYQRGAMIARAGDGWALADSASVSDQVAARNGADVSRLMDRANSTL